jgi:hypothetical protein
MWLLVTDLHERETVQMSSRNKNKIKPRRDLVETTMDGHIFYSELIPWSTWNHNNNNNNNKEIYLQQKYQFFGAYVTNTNFSPVVTSEVETRVYSGDIPKFLKFWTYIKEQYFLHITYLLTYSIQHSPSWEANQSLQLVTKFPAFLWNPKVLYRTHKCPPSDPNPSQLHPVPTTPSNFLKTHLNIILPSMSGSPQWPLSLRFPHQHPVHTALLPHTCYMPRPPSSRFLPPA